MIEIRETDEYCMDCAHFDRRKWKCKLGIQKELDAPCPNYEPDPPKKKKEKDIMEKLVEKVLLKEPARARIAQKMGDIEIEIIGNAREVIEIYPILLQMVKPYAFLRKPTTRDVLLKLRDEGFFSTPKTLREIYAQVTSMGHKTTMSNLHHALQSLVAEGKLKRLGEKGKFQYES